MQAVQREMPPIQVGWSLGQSVGAARQLPGSAGFAQHHLGRHDQARESYQRALALAQHAGNAFLQAEILTHLADTDHITGDHEAARQTWRQAQVLYERLGHPHADAIGLRLHPDPGLSPPAAI